MTSQTSPTLKEIEEIIEQNQQLPVPLAEVWRVLSQSLIGLSSRPEANGNASTKYRMGVLAGLIHRALVGNAVRPDSETIRNNAVRANFELAAFGITLPEDLFAKTTTDHLPIYLEELLALVYELQRNADQTSLVFIKLIPKLVTDTMREVFPDR